MFDEFEEFGNFGFGEDAAPARGLYDTLVDMLKDAFDLSDGTYEGARAYARALLFGEARTTLQRAWAQLQPSTVSDLLDEMEADYRIQRDFNDSDDTRRARLVAAKLLMRGARLEAITTALIAELGSDFLALRYTKASELQTYPASPATQSIFPALSAVPRFYKLIDSVATLTLRPTLRIQAINGSSAPLAGEKLSVESEILGNAEVITLQIVTALAGTSDQWAIVPSAPFTKAHSVGASLLTATAMWLSNQREVRVVVSDAASRDPEKRRKTNVVMARYSKAVTRWRIVAASGASSLGPFVIGAGHNIIGATALGATPGSF